MKTDLERFQELYASLGIELKVHITQDNAPFKPGTRDIQRVTLIADPYPGDTETASDKFDGYGGFESTIDFDMDGKFIKQGFWE